jgi:hypothetical protein
MTKSNVSDGVAIVFGDGETRVIRPLTLKQLRKFVVVIDKLGATESAVSMSDEDIDTMVDAAEIILSKIDPKLAEDREALEDAVDLISFNKMMTVAMGNTVTTEE